jgi:hemerythrin-like domain-containing protein
VVKQFQLRQARQQLESLEARTDTQREYVEELESEVTTAKEAATEEIDDLIDDMKAFNATISRDAERTERIAAEYYGGSVDKAIEAVKERAEERSDVDGGITDD